jgi:hypothetical protein
MLTLYAAQLCGVAFAAVHWETVALIAVVFTALLAGGWYAHAVTQRRRNYGRKVLADPAIALAGADRSRWVFRHRGQNPLVFEIDDARGGRVGTLRSINRWLYTRYSLELSSQYFLIEAPPRRQRLPGCDSAIWPEQGSAPLATSVARTLGPIEIGTPLGTMTLHFSATADRPNELRQDGRLIGFTYSLGGGDWGLDFALPKSAQPVAAFVFWQTWVRG